MKKYNARIVNKGFGCFLNPPTYPEYSKSVFFWDIKPEFGQYCCLSYAVDWNRLEDNIKQAAKQILDTWQKPDINNPDIQKWILKVMKTYKHLYRGLDGNWAWSDLLKDKQYDPVINQDSHAGVHFIRKYYPEFILK